MLRDKEGLYFKKIFEPLECADNESQGYDVFRVGVKKQEKNKAIMRRLTPGNIPVT